MVDEFYPAVKAWVGEALADGRDEKDILSCLRAFGKLAIEQELKGEDEDGSEADCD